MTASELVSRVPDLPVVSPAALKLVALLDQPFASNEEIVDVLKYDPVLTAKLLRVCNSPYFGFQEKICSVDQAVLVLGHQQILQVVLSLTFGGAMSVPLPGYGAEAEELWSHSLHTALAAEALCSSGIQSAFEAPVLFTACLLHDIGKLVLTHVLTMEIQAVIRSRIASEGMARNEAEKQILGTDHAEVGACLLEEWRLPTEIIEGVAHHHSPVSRPRPALSALVHTANCVAHLSGSTLGWEGFAIRTDMEALDALSITREKLESMMITLHDSVGRVEEFMALS
jgi:putative nucleotidyltransferase with HDIG domain